MDARASLGLGPWTLPTCALLDADGQHAQIASLEPIIAIEPDPNTSKPI